MAFFSMIWRTPKTAPPPLPTGITRSYIKTSSGPLELLSAIPTTPTKRTPIFFAHGGFGCASVWQEYMTFFSQTGIPCYAVSIRGHGNSWYPSFLRMVYWTTKRTLANDFLVGIKHVQDLEKERNGNDKAEVVLVGHSSGGGLSQFLLSEGDVKAKALILIGSIPGFGSFPVYVNWWTLDPLFTIRCLWHGWHPKSPLSSTRLVKQVFFGRQMTDDRVRAFEKLLPPYESFIWPIQMMVSFVNIKSVVQNITGWGSSERIMVLAGQDDAITTKKIMYQMVNVYRAAVKSLVKDKKLEVECDESTGTEDKDNHGEGVNYAVVPFAGHHMQNDVNWEYGAKKVLAFYEKL